MGANGASDLIHSGEFVECTRTPTCLGPFEKLGPFFKRGISLTLLGP